MPTRRTPTLAAVVLCLLAAGCSGSTRNTDPLASAAMAAAAGDWMVAFDEYRLAAAASPDDPAALTGLTTAADHLIVMVPGLPPETEVPLLRWLESQDRLGDVAAVLNGSVVAIPAGWAVMGSSSGRRDEQPIREVRLDRFAIDRYETTNLQYEAHLAATGGPAPGYWVEGSYPSGTATQPVVGVSWRQAADFCAAAGKRLPTEAEWERACRGESGLVYPWGDEWEEANLTTTHLPLDDPDEAWQWLVPTAEAPAGLRPVGEPLAGVSPYGVCNLAGNASEWVADWYDAAAYEELGHVNPVGDGPPWNRSIRGGSWLFRHRDPDLLADQARCAFRNSSHAADDPRVGFRCASDAG